MARRQRIMGGLAAVFAAALIAAGCGADDATDGGDGKKDFDGSVKIGAIVPLTGDLGPFGKAGNRALELAVEQINAAAKDAGLDGEAELVAEDGETKEEAGKAAAEKLTRKDDVSCIVGDWASSSTISVAKSVTIEEGVPLISPSSTAAEITELEDDGTVFRTVPSDGLQAQLLADAIAEDLGGKGTVMVAARNNAYGTGLAESFQEAATEAGLTVEGPVLMDPDAPQADSEAQQITKDAADAYLIVDYPEAWQKLGPALARTGNWDPAKTWTSDGLRDASLPKTAGKDVTEGMRGTAPTSSEAPAAEPFNTLWEAEANTERQTYDADNFDAAIACYLAAVAAGSADPEDVAGKMAEVSGPPGDKYTFENLSEAIEALQNGDDIDYEGAAGPLNWDDNGDPSTADYELWTYKGGKLVTLETRSFGAGGGEEEEGATTTGDDEATEEEDAA